MRIDIKKIKMDFSNFYNNLCLIINKILIISDKFKGWVK